MKNPILLEPRHPNPEAMQVTGSTTSALAIVKWLDSKGISADYVPNKLIQGPDGPMWDAEHIFVHAPGGFRRKASLRSWILVGQDGEVTVLSDAVKKKLWKEKVD